MSRIRRDERGSLAPAVPLLALVLLLLGGLVIDASRLLNARGRAVAYAEEAARAGAAAVVRGSATLVVDPGQARFFVERFCQQLLDDPTQGSAVTSCTFRGVEAASDDDPRQISVRVRVELALPATLLGIVGVQSLDASGEARARPFEGVNPRDLDSDLPAVVVPEPVEPVDPVLPPGPITVPAPEPSPSPSPSPSPLPSPEPSPAPSPAPEVPPAPPVDPPVTTTP